MISTTRQAIITELNYYSIEYHGFTVLGFLPFHTTLFIAKLWRIQNMGYIQLDQQTHP